MYSSSRRASEIASNAICLARDGLSAGDLSEISCRYGSAARAVSPGCNAHHPPPCFQRPWLSTSRVYAPFRSHAPRHADAPGASQSNASDSCVSSLDAGGNHHRLVQGIPLGSGHSPSSEHPRVCHRRHSNPARYPVDGAAPDAAVCQASIRRRSMKLLGEKAPAEPSPTLDRTFA